MIDSSQYLLNIQQAKIRTPTGFKIDVANFHVKQGEITAIVGQSGSGKSLFAQGILQLYPETSSIRSDFSMCYKGAAIDTHDLASMQLIRHQEIAIVLQDYQQALNPIYKIYDQIVEVFQATPNALERVTELMDIVALNPSLLSSYPHQLSGGQLQRVLLAIALANNPSLLILDEPTSALDVRTQSILITRLQQLVEANTMSIILISHNLRLVEHFAHRVHIMHKGRVTFSGDTQQALTTFLDDLPLSHMDINIRHVDYPPQYHCNSLLTCKNLCVSYYLSTTWWRPVSTNEVIHNVSFSIYPNEILGIIGSSGSGKTTLVKALLQLIPYQGLIMFEGVSLKTLSKHFHRRKCAHMQIVFQDTFACLNPQHTILTLLQEIMAIHFPCYSHATTQKMITQTLNDVGLDSSILSLSSSSLSGGERQRVAIARALLIRPRIIALDEPTAFLDSASVHKLIHLLLHLQEKYNLTYLIISHDPNIIHMMCHRVMTLDAGCIVEEGSCAEVFRTPHHPTTKRLLSTIAFPCDGEIA